MFSQQICLLASVAVALATVAAPAHARANDPHDAAAIEFFEKKVRPILVDNCYNCHSANTNARGGLRVDDRNGLIHGGGSGAAVIPGQPDESLLIQAVRYEGLEMPPKKRLEPEQISILEQWIRDGAAWPKVDASFVLTQQNDGYDRLRKEHWAWQPLTAPAVPTVSQADWPRDDIDRFVLATLEQKKLSPVGDADRATLIRRLRFDLTGLPPTPAEIDAFVEDTSETAVANLVDRLLAAPSFGERWGRHWLDVARYGESTGSARNLPYPHAWRYRDYVIDAFNKDKPFDQFIHEQVAGDLLPATSPSQKAEQLVATGFLALGVKDVNQRFKVRFIMDNIDEQIDTVTRSFLGVTASCARCHDHKFDPIPTADYYALAGIFHSTDLCAALKNRMGGSGLAYYDTSLLLDITLSDKADAPSPETIEKARQEFAKAQKEFNKLRNNPEGDVKTANGRPRRAVARQKMNKLQQELLALTDPAVRGDVALGVRDAAQVGDTEIRLRGEAEQLGPTVPRGFLTLFETDAAEINPQQSGRLELARWLTSADNPLTPRVFVNRVWQHLFGDGLVSTVDNFGVTGDVPSHPELLDHLATRFVQEGWSVKKLVRALVLSRVYQLDSAGPETHLAADPANRLLWRHNPRRLDAEEIRDAMLLSSGDLITARPTTSLSRELPVIELRNNAPEAQRLAAEALASRHRSVYLPLLRGLTPTSLAVFDFAEQGMVTGQRDTTTVATQALYLLNDPFVKAESIALARSLLADSDRSESERLSEAYRRTLGRDASTAELSRAQSFLADYREAAEAVLAAAPAVAPAEPELAAAAPTDAQSEEAAAAVIDPDSVVYSDTVVEEAPAEVLDPQTAAWASFCQAVFGSAEFRYLK